VPTKIEWTDETWNPVTGCTPVSAACEHCWARRFSRRTFGQRPFSEVRCHPERLDQPLHWRQPRKIAVCLMADLFHAAVPAEFIDQVFAVMASAQRHTFQLLTKRPERMLGCLHNPSMGEYIWYLANRTHGPFMNKPWPLPNVQFLVSIEDQSTADARILLLLQTPAAMRGVSYEPALGPVDLSPWLPSVHWNPENTRFAISPALDWVIAGGESGPGARPSHPDYFRSGRDQCVAANVPFFFKQWGEWVGFEDSRGAFRTAKRIHSWADGRCSYYVGKKRAGRLLDGRQWNEFPKL